MTPSFLKFFLSNRLVCVSTLEAVYNYLYCLNQFNKCYDFPVPGYTGYGYYNGCGFSNTAHCEYLPSDTVLVIHFIKRDASLPSLPRYIDLSYPYNGEWIYM